MTNCKISFIGAGQMSEALISRLTAGEIMASDVNLERLQYLKKKYNIKIAQNNLEAAYFGEVVVLAVKPQNVAEVLDELPAASGWLPSGKLIISIAAGITLKYLQKALPKAAVIRAMPNNPALIGEGITALAKGKKVNSAHLEIAKQIFSAVGQVVEVNEKYLDAVTGLSGSGPAFVYQVVEGLIKGGIKAGLSPKLATQLAVQTTLGAAKTLQETGKSPTELTGRVASPGGTTIEGLKVLKKRKAVEAFTEAVLASTKKSKFLSNKF